MDSTVHDYLKLKSAVMIKKYIFSLLIVLSACSFLSAQESEILYLEDGSILKGLIVEQEPGKKILFSGELVKISQGLRMVSEDLYEIPWSDISYIEKEDRSDLLLSGTKSEIVLKNSKSYIGIIKEMHPGVKIKFKDEGDKVHEFDYSDIKTIKTIEINPDQSLVEQFCYMDRIILKNSKIIDGYIVMQNIGRSLSVIIDDGSEIDIKLGDISVLKKLTNGKYNPIYDVVLQPGQYVYNNLNINFQDIEPTPAYIYIVNTESDDVIEAGVGQKVSIYANLIDTTTEMKAVKTLLITENARLVGNKKNHYETFKMDDFAATNIVIEKSKPTKAGTTEFSFTLYETGYYVLRVGNEKGFIIIRVS